MKFFSRISDGAERAHRMSQRLNVSFAKELVEHPDSVAQAYRGILLRCVSCACKSDCQALLDSNTVLTEAPSYCPNRAVFNKQRDAA